MTQSQPPPAEPDETPLTPLREPAEGIPTVVVADDQYQAVVSAFAAGSGPVAIDAERASGYRYGQSAYLVQLRRAGAGTALIDPQQIRDLNALGQALDGVEWVLHAASQDLPCLAELNLRPTRLFDTELAGRLLGRERVGLGAMVASELGLELAKEHSAADWSTRPLPADWLRYAALDVEVLVELRDHLAAELQRDGKLEWALQEFETVRLAPPPQPREEPWRRTSGSHKIRDSLGLAIVRELWQVRESQARAADTAPGRILSDAAIIAAATTKPTTMPQLAALRPFQQKSAVRRMRTWFQALNHALALPQSQHPDKRGPVTDMLPPPRAWKERNPDAAQRLDVVRVTIRSLAEDLCLPQENLLTPDYQRRLAWDTPSDRSPGSIAEILATFGARKWQIELVAGPLSDVLGAPTPKV